MITRVLDRIRSARRQGEQDDGMSVMSPWAIRVGAVIVLIVGALSGWLLMSYFGSGRVEDKVRLQILQLTGNVVVGAGGAVALLLAARRQRATEVDLVQKKRAAAVARHDADERRVTELYTSAAEQLGSDKAAVRLAGLYALERLAQENPKHRQTIVDVICAYLRMPYTPPPDKEKPGRQDARVQRRGLRPPERTTMSSLRTRKDGTFASTMSSDADSPREEKRQELQVRMAAQRLLAEHLRPEPDDQGRRTNVKFWQNIKIDLTGAILVEYDVGNCQVSSAIFEDAEFHGMSFFGGATFSGPAKFDNATFHDIAMFDDARFYGSTRFLETTFHGDAVFTGVDFCGRVSFGSATHRGAQWFSNATFHDTAEFDGSTVYGICNFNRAVFRGSVRFSEVTRHSHVWFDEAIFYESVSVDDFACYEGFDFTAAQARFEKDHEWPSGWELRWGVNDTALAGNEWGALVWTLDKSNAKYRDGA